MKELTASDQETRSVDVVVENIEHLRNLFPEAFTEGKIDFEVLKQLLGDNVDDRDEKYGLNWHGKRQARQLALTPSTGTLRPCPEDSVDWDTTQNLMIEGDNLEVLKLLQKSYAGKVKLIYIDPPYNTGKDFVYPDNYRDNIQNYLELTGQVDNTKRKLSSNSEASGRFHTDWLNMIYPRLKVARDLLRNDGAIFVSIDDNEVDNLRKVCAEIFGEENFLACVCWERADSPKMDADHFSTRHDYLVCYAKNAECFRVQRKLYEDDETPSHFSKTDEDGRKYYTKPLRAMGGQGETRAARPKLYYEILAPDGSSVYPKLEGGGDGAWRWSPQKLAKEFHRIEWVKQDSNWTPYFRIYADESPGMPPETIWTAGEVGSTRKATAEVKKLFDGVKCFDTPKPIALICKIIELSTGSDDIIMDFFAGSGTSGHAVLEVNNTDRGSRRYILVQLPESLEPQNKEQKTAADFCDKIGKSRNIVELTKERLRRARGIIRDAKPKLAGDLGFRVFKLDTSNFRMWEPDYDDLTDAFLASINRIKPDRSEEDILFELLLKLGLDLCVPVETKTIAGKTIYSVGAGTLIACLDEDFTREEIEPLALGIVEWHKDITPLGDSTVVLRDSAFADDVAKINFATILEQHGIESVRSL